MKLRVAAKSDIGLKRKINEDSWLINPDLGLYVIADGMGGHRAGEIASRMAVDTIEEYWKNVKAGKPPAFLHPIDANISIGAKHLINSIYFANMMIHEAQKKPQYYKMGSTVSALYIEKDCIWSANVGDSQVYIFDHGHLILVSEEHSIAAEQRSMGLFDSHSSTNPAIKNLLTRVLGLEEKVEVYITPVRPETGDIILLCSDGLTNYLSGQSIITILNDFSISLERKVDVLIEEANLGGGGDNITLILLEVLDVGSRWKKIKRRLITKD
ncbi:PP2C family protein-serine/threonine phosphatase [Thermodesulfobacteriota bacterium]